MRKLKIISMLLIIVIMFEFILCPPITFCADQTGDDTVDKSVQKPAGNYLKNDTGTKIITEGEADGFNIGDLGASIIGTITGIVCMLINIVIIQVDVILSLLVNTTIVEDSTNVTDTLYGGVNSMWLMLEKIIFNRVSILNINYFDYSDSYKVDDVIYESNATNTKIKESVAKVYYQIRIISLVMSLLVLIYVGIRMATSTIASDQAKYQKMFFGWFASVIILFLMPYIMEVTFAFCEILISVFAKLEYTLINTSVETTSGAKLYCVFEVGIRQSIMNSIMSLNGLQLTYWSIMYYILLFTEIKFLFLYVKRLLMIGFLIVISPIITVIYPIDKVGDGQAQTFNVWVREFVSSVLIQPLHAIIYLIFLLSANAIAQQAPLIGIVLLISIPTVERMVKTIFTIEFSAVGGLHEMKLLKK